MTAVPAAVIDTNVLLAWLIFRDPCCVAIGEAIETGALRWLATTAMHAEFSAVLVRGVGAQRAPDLKTVSGVWHRHAVMLPAPSAHQGHHDCRCTDPDDQMFIDLALAERARWLLSRDRAVLKLARRAHRRGLAIIPPARWSPMT